jgi:hypothetical protein
MVAMALATAAVSGGAQIEILHEPVSCVTVDRYSRISAEGVPAHHVVRAEVQLRTGADSAWYAIEMAAAGTGWSALLPRAMPSLSGFEYRIVMTAGTGTAATTPPFTVHVSGGAQGCAASQDALESSIVVHTPRGAPVVPPVPPGFSPAGVVAAQEPRPRRSKKPLVVGAGAAAIGGTAAVLASTTDDDRTPLPDVRDIPSFGFAGTIPNPGAVLSVSHDSLVILMTMSREPPRPFDFLWRLELWLTADDVVCAVMQGAFSGAKRPLNLVLTAPLSPTGACGQRFDVSRGRLTIDVAGARVYDALLSLPFHLEP